MPYGKNKSRASRVKGVPGISEDKGGKIRLDSKFKQSKQANKKASKQAKLNKKAIFCTNHIWGIFKDWQRILRSHPW